MGAPHAVDAATSHADTKSPKLSVLLADDNPMIRKLLERLFTYVAIHRGNLDRSCDLIFSPFALKYVMALARLLLMKFFV